MQIIGYRTLYRDGEYVAFPNLARFPDGSVVCAFRHAKERQKEFGRVTHVDPTARDVFIVSSDGGKSFGSDLHVIVDDEMSDQDPSVNVLRDGRILVTYFRWQLVPLGRGAAAWGKANFKKYGRSLHGLYDCYPNGVSYSVSDDGGRSWSSREPLRMEGLPDGAGVRGNIVELPSGRLLMPFYGSLHLGELSRAGLLKSDDRGDSWQYLSVMGFDESCKKNYLEPGIFRTRSGRIVALFRTQSDFTVPGVGFDDTYLNLHIAVSVDDGRTFGPVEEIGGFYSSSPIHALQLRSGRVLLSYGYRKRPFGIRARLCNAELTDIGSAPEMVLRSDAPNGDLGYPSSLQLDDGTVLVSYYICGKDGIRTIDASVLREDGEL